MTESSRTVVAVAGDQMVDWQIIGGHAAEAGLDLDWFWRAGAAFQLAAEPLGAEPLGEVVEALLASGGRSGECAAGDGAAGALDAVVLRQPLPEGATTDPSVDCIGRSLSYWMPVRAVAGDAAGRGAEAWRVARMVGRTPAAAGCPGAPLPVCDVSAGAPDVVALVDLDMGFRDDSARWRRTAGGRVRMCSCAPRTRSARASSGRSCSPGTASVSRSSSTALICAAPPSRSSSR